MQYSDLRSFLGGLESAGELLRIDESVSPALEMTAIADIALHRAGPAILFERPGGFEAKVLANLFGTPRRVALGMGAADSSELRQLGALLAVLREPEPLRGLADAGRLMDMAKALWNMRPSTHSSGPCRDVCLEGSAIDLTRWPVQTCWPG